MDFRDLVVAATEHFSEAKAWARALPMPPSEQPVIRTTGLSETAIETDMYEKGDIKVVVCCVEEEDGEMNCCLNREELENWSCSIIDSLLLLGSLKTDHS